MAEPPAAASPAPESPHLELICLGAPTARLEGQRAPAGILGRRPLALLLYLALSPHRTRTRDHLVGVLWPEKEGRRAKHSLNETVRLLRRALGAGRLVSVGDALTLSDAGLEVDALRFSAAAPHEPARALALLRGDFLEGFAVPDAPGFEDWAAGERERHRALAASLLVTEGEQRLAACHFAAAQDAARRALSVQPYAEPAARLLMRAAALSGDVAGAMAAYHDFSGRLAQGIGEKPGRDLATLSQRIRQQSWRPAAARQLEPVPPLVGREAIHREAFGAIAQGLTDGPRTLVITGAPGIGRTRLLMECLERLALEGATVALARPLPSDHDAPWSSLRLLVRGGLQHAPGLVAARPDALGVLAGLVPELAERTAPRAPRDAADMASALAGVLEALAAERPVGLAIDDGHLCDGATIGALASAMGQVRAAALVLIVTAVEGAPHAPPELLQLRCEAGRSLRGASVRLDPLSTGDIRALIPQFAPWCKDDDQRDRLARRLMFETGGNPFFVVTLLGGLQRLARLREDFIAWPRPRATFETPLPISVPDLARLAVAARVAELDEESRRVLSAASIAGGALELNLVAALADVPRDQIESRLAEAERQHLIKFDGKRYAFAAPLIADTVRRECLTGGQRQALQRRAIAELAARQDLEARVLRAELRAAVEPGQAAFEEALAVGLTALAEATERTARRALAAAERAGAELTAPQRAPLENLRVRLTP